MARCPLVRPDTVRIGLSEDDWLELKKELTAGEYRSLVVGQFKDATVGDRMSIDLGSMGISEIMAYLVDWSFVDFNGHPLVISRETVDKFDSATYQEVLKAVETHHAAWEQAVEARKNGHGGESKSAPISSSVA